MKTPDFIVRFKTIILVGDNFVDNDVHRRLLESMNIADKFMVFSNALEAINHLTLISKIENTDKTEIELIILELSIPVMDAWYFIELFKIVCTVSHPNAKIIIISDIFTEMDIERMRSEPLVSCFIKKPLTSNKIIDCLKNSLAFRPKSNTSKS